MAFAILKLSYNRPGDSSLTGGICGTGFFVDSTTGITAHHVLNEGTFTPNNGFCHALVWVISRSGSVRRIERESATLHPEIDATVVTFRNPLSNVRVYETAVGSLTDGLPVCGIGHVGNSMPSVEAEWRGSELVIRSANLAGVIKDTNGYVKRSVTLNINANDIKMQETRGFELSFGSRVGMSGGPVVDIVSGRVLGMLSLGLPPDSNVKTETFAISIDEIRKCYSL